MGGDSGDLNSPRGDVDEEEDVVSDEAEHGQDLDGEDVRGRDGAQMRL